METSSDAFEKNVQDYLHRLASIDFESVENILGIAHEDGRRFISFFNQRYLVSSNGILDESGDRPDYRTFVILAKYLLLCPDQLYHDPHWVSFKDFKRTSHFTNTNYFSSDTERAIEKYFAGKPGELEKVCVRLNGSRHEMDISYDLSMRFDALPRISLLLLFNDGDEEFPAKSTVLFQKHAEYYLDPESLAVTSASLVSKLRQSA
jgi:hypothetical protein